jgi:hypothetical protein
MITSQTYLHKYFNSKPLDEYSWFKYELGWKVYSVDGHEKPATSEYHQKAFFCEHYLAYEARMHHWFKSKKAQG